jgi:multidrug efflux pump subunit AcrA (membrane-fusion protein)
MLLVSFGLAGFVNPGFWLLGLAGLVAMVGGRSASERFQKLVDAERLQARKVNAEDRMKLAYDRLQPASQARYRALVVVCREVLGLGSLSGEDGLSDFRTGNLNQMLWLFLRLLASRESITDTIARIDRRQLESGVESLKGRLAAAGDPDAALARSLRATLEIQEKRLANLDTATNNLAVIDAELERIEQQVRLVREEGAVSRSPEAISARLDSVSSTLSETSRWMDQHTDLMSDMTSLDLDAASVPSLPGAPREAPLSLDEPEEDEERKPRPPRPRTGQRQR